MILGTIKFDDATTNIRLLNFLIIRHCRYYVKSYCSSKETTEDKERLQKLQVEIKSLYNLNTDIKNIILEILNYIFINSNHNLELQAGYIEGIPVEKLYKLISFGNLSVKGAPIFEKAIKYAMIRKNWRI